MIKNILAACAATICCIGAAEVPGTKPVQANTNQEVMQCISMITANLSVNDKALYCITGIQALKAGYSMQQAIQMGNAVIQSTAVNNMILNGSNPYAGSTFRWQDPGSIWN
jgi:hypothetical protein